MLSKDKLNNASGLFSLMNRLGAGIGIATANSFLENKITKQYISMENIVSQRMESSSIFMSKLRNVTPKDFGDSFESTKYANQLLYYITTQESTIIAFNQIMLVMGALALCIAPLALLLKGVKT